MLQSYQVIYDHGHLTRLTDKLSVKEAHVIVTLLSTKETPVLKAKRRPSPCIAGQGKILGDIIASATPIEDWNGLA